MQLSPLVEPNDSRANHPLAPRMCAIAFLSNNIILGCMFGSFGVLVPAVEAKLGVTRELSSFGLPCVLLGLAVMSPLAGVLAGRFSIRLLLMVGALMSAAGYAILALSQSIYLNLAIYTLLLGPGQALSAIVLPTTLVSRWYNVNRGRALGLVTMPIVAMMVPLVASMALRTFGLSATYFLLAAAVALTLLPLMFVIDYPPDAFQPSGESVAGADELNAGMSIRELMGQGRFWALSIVAASMISTATALSAHIVPMTRDWGLDATRAASLLAIASLGGMAGSVTFGWVADRLGGTRTLALLCFDSAILWVLMLFQPPFIVIALIVGLLGLHGSAMIATFGMALSQHFGRASYARAFGLGYLLSLPFSVLVIPAVAHVSVRTGSYTDALIGMAGFLLFTALLALVVRTPRSAIAT